MSCKIMFFWSCILITFFSQKPIGFRWHIRKLSPLSGKKRGQRLHRGGGTGAPPPSRDRGAARAELQTVTQRQLQDTPRISLG